MDIEDECTTSGIAADLCANHTDGTYSDWFLPSKDELNKMYLNIGQGNALGLGNIGGLGTATCAVPFCDRYWSSTEYSPNTARFQDIGDGTGSVSYTHLTLPTILLV